MPKPFVRRKDTMQCFALGTAPKKSKQKRRLQPKSKRAFVLVPKQPQWRLLPSHACEGFDFWIDTLKGTTYVQKKESLKTQVAFHEQPRSCPFAFPPSTLQFQEDFLMKSKQVFALLKRNQALRWILKRFFTLARIRRFKNANDTDPITFEPFQQPIHVISFSTRVVYRFEANSFAKHAHKRLLNSDGLLPLPTVPQNPLTNELFSLHQLISLFYQSKQYGHSFWTLEAFLASHYTTSKFLVLHNKPLRLNALHTMLRKVETWDCIDTVYDFIKSQHETHGKQCCSGVYKWAVLHMPRQETIVKWRDLCKKWYEVDILLEDEFMKEIEFGKLERLTLPLCEVPLKLNTLRIQYLSQHRRENGRRNSSDS